MLNAPVTRQEQFLHGRAGSPRLLRTSNQVYHHPDPYADDTILFTITAANLQEHAAHLSEGQKALLPGYPNTWRMQVYPTRRSASYPLWVYEASKANALTAEVIVDGKGGVEKATITSPSPIPQSGLEIIWNHNLRWRGIQPHCKRPCRGLETRIEFSGHLFQAD